MNLAKNLENSARFFPNKPALREGDTELTYEQLNSKVNQVATALIDIDVAPGDLVGLCAPNSIDWIIFYFGVIKTGAAAVTLFSTVTTVEMNRLMEHAKPKILFTTPERISELEHFKGSGIAETIICSKNSPLTLTDLMEKGRKTFNARKMDRNDTAAVLYTGGTTGNPKGVMLSHAGIIFSTHAVAFNEKSSPDDFALCFQPFNHVFGQIHIMNATIYSAGCLELLPSADLDKILALTEAGRITKFFSVPTVYIRMLKIPDLKKKLGRVNYCFSAAASMAREIVRQWKETTGITIAESLGMTECMPVSFNHFYPDQHVVGSVGQVTCGMELEIRDMYTGEVLPQGEDGEICVRGTNVMKGYLNNPEETENAFWEDGFLRTGDIGHLDENEFLFIVDRLKEIIITGGENVFPREVEEIIYTIPGMEECTVIGVPDPEWGEKIVAIVKMRPGETFNEEESRAYLKTHLAPFKVPKDFQVFTDLPKSAAGKILKREIRQQITDTPDE